MASSLISYSSSRDDIKHLLPTSCNNPAKRKRKTSSYTPIVQYRRSGQYYRYSSCVDRESQSQPKRYIAVHHQEKENGEICEYESKTEARNDESSKNKTTNKSLVQALRNLYHFGRVPSSDEIYSFASQQYSDTSKSEDDERRETKRLRRADQNDLRCVVTDESSKNSTDTTDTESCSEDDGFSYGGLKASDYYSADLVVEWDITSSSSSFSNDDEEEMVILSTTNTTDHHHHHAAKISKTA